MTSSNGNFFRVTGPLCGEFTGPGEFPAQRPVTWCFDVFFDLRLNKRLSKQPWGWWFEMPSWSLWRQCNAVDCAQWRSAWALPYHFGNESDYWIKSNIHNKTFVGKNFNPLIHFTSWFSSQRVKLLHSEYLSCVQNGKLSHMSSKKIR